MVILLTTAEFPLLPWRSDVNASGAEYGFGRCAATTAADAHATTRTIADVRMKDIDRLLAKTGEIRYLPGGNFLTMSATASFRRFARCGSVCSRSTAPVAVARQIATFLSRLSMSRTTVPCSRTRSAVVGVAPTCGDPQPVR